jgi:hypothetical protein
MDYIKTAVTLTPRASHPALKGKTKDHYAHNSRHPAHKRKKKKKRKKRKKHKTETTGFRQLPIQIV